MRWQERELADRIILLICQKVKSMLYILTIEWNILHVSDCSQVLNKCRMTECKIFEFTSWFVLRMTLGEIRIAYSRRFYNNLSWNPEYVIPVLWRIKSNKFLKCDIDILLSLQNIMIDYRFDLIDRVWPPWVLSRESPKS